MEELYPGGRSLGSVLERVRDLSTSDFAAEIQKKLNEFRSLRNQPWEILFGELCFCILAANTSAEMGLRTQNLIGIDGFLNLSQLDLAARLRNVKYRFYNLRSKFIVQARSIGPCLPEILNFSPWDAREYLVSNVMGIGYKEASHFLRNVGIFSFAILDKHILRMLSGGAAPLKVSSPRKYLEIEKIFIEIASSVDMEPGVLDLYMWKIATGKLIK